MFKLSDTFKLCDDNKQPYSVHTERHSEIFDLHAGVDERGFVLRSIGNRFLLQTPSLKTFTFELKYYYTFVSEFDPPFNVLFGYDPACRTGIGLNILPHLSGGVTVSLIKVSRMKVETLFSVDLSEYMIADEKESCLKLAFDGSVLKGSIDGYEFSFAADAACGKIAIERKNFIGELVLTEFSLESADDIEEEILLDEQTVEIPLTDGGDIPYLFSYAIRKYGDLCCLDTKLSGGTATRILNREDRPGQYVAETDKMTSPFVTLRSGEKTERFYIFNGLKTFVDPNIFWECLKDYFGNPKLPITGRYVIGESMIQDDLLIGFGYENLLCKGYGSQAGGSEFLFTAAGELVYSGDILGESMFELYSPKDKFAVSLIPADAYKREEIIAHLESNHYFHVDEDISLTFSTKTKLDPEFLSVKCEIRDVYDSVTLKAPEAVFTVQDWKFGYTELLAQIKTEPMPLGVYRAVFTVSLGDGVYKRFERAFEVFDKDSAVSPAVASGLPYVFSMPNEQKWLMRNSFDLWTPKASCDIGHYISCVTDTPIEAETRKIWDMIKPFGREWFAWLEDRTCRDWEKENHPDVVKNADYLYIPAKTQVFPLRNDLYLAKTYQNPVFRAYLHEFMDLHPDIAEKLTYKKTETLDFVTAPLFDESNNIPVYVDFTYEDLENLMAVCHKEWMEFALEKLLQDIREQNEELLKLNPAFKRAAYGPFNQYSVPTLSYHTVKSFGNLPYNTLSEDVYTGFAVFEDYPAACAYQTYRGAFAVMTILLHSPGLKLYPEQYKSGIGGCIDGAVKFSHSPMGKYDMPVYFNTTHGFEFVFNTARRTAEGYRYWDTYGFHRPDYPPEMMDKVVKDWKAVLEHKPARPLRTMAFVAEYYDEEDIYDGSIINFHGHTNLYNVSEEAHGYLYECVREGGLNAPFALKFETLKDLHADECDVLVLPTLRYTDESAKAEIRRLYSEGVSLLAASHVDGLEDIFGVRADEKTVYIHGLESSDGEYEDIYPNDAVFRYAADGAEVLLAAGEGTPVLLKKGRAVLLNSAVTTLGHECFEGTAGKGRKNVSDLLRKIVTEAAKSISAPAAEGKNVGVTLFEDVNGCRNLLCIDYSHYLNTSFTERKAEVRFNIPVSRISSDREFTQLRDKNGNIREVHFMIKPHESVMFTFE